MSIATSTCPAWCTDHVGEPGSGGDDWHSTGYVPLADTSINMATGTLDGSARVFGLDCMPAATTLEDAEQLAFTLLGMVAAARA